MSIHIHFIILIAKLVFRGKQTYFWRSGIQFRIKVICGIEDKEIWVLESVKKKMDGNETIWLILKVEQDDEFDIEISHSFEYGAKPLKTWKWKIHSLLKIKIDSGILEISGRVSITFKRFWVGWKSQLSIQ